MGQHHATPPPPPPQTLPTSLHEAAERTFAWSKENQHLSALIAGAALFIIYYLAYWVLQLAFFACFVFILWVIYTGKNLDEILPKARTEAESHHHNHHHYADDDNRRGSILGGVVNLAAFNEKGYKWLDVQ